MTSITIRCPRCKDEDKTVFLESIYDRHGDIKERTCDKCQDIIDNLADQRHVWCRTDRHVDDDSQAVHYYYKCVYCKGTKALTMFYDGRKAEIYRWSLDEACAENRLEKLLA